MPTRTHLALGLALLLAGCSTVGVPLNTGPRMRAVDAQRDDIASLSFVFDLPRGIGPLRDGTIVEVGGAAPLKTSLVEAEADELGARLPPPGQGRAYYFAGFSANDQTAIRKLQQGHAGDFGIDINPAFCRSGDVDPKEATVSVLVVQPDGTQLSPLIDHWLLSRAIKGGTLPTCT